MRAGFKGQRDSSAIFFDEFRVNLGFQIAGEPRPAFALVGCHLRLQQLGYGDRIDNQDDSHHDQNARLTDWTSNLDAVSQSRYKLRLTVTYMRFPHEYETAR